MHGKRGKKKDFRSWTLHIGTKKARTAVVMMCLSLSVLFILLGIVAVQLLKPNHQNSLAMRILHSVSNRSLVSVFNHEIPLYASAGEMTRPLATERKFGLSNLLFYLFTDVDPKNPLTLLGYQIPGMAVSDFELLSKDGSYSVPPTNVASDAPHKMEEPKQPPEIPTPPQVDGKTGDQPVAYIYHTHNRESFLPELNTDDPDKAYDAVKNISSVGSFITEALNKKKIPTIQTKVDYWTYGNYNKSYDYSRPTVEDILKKNKSIEMVFDIHRDDGPRQNTTRLIDGKDTAAVFFIIGGANPHYEQNYKFAEMLHNKMNEMYPGVSRGIWKKPPNPNYDTRYNQDLFPNSVLIEIGGPENSMAEENRTADMIANVIAAVYRDLHKGNE